MIWICNSWRPRRRRDTCLVTSCCTATRRWWPRRDAAPTVAATTSLSECAAPTTTARATTADPNAKQQQQSTWLKCHVTRNAPISSTWFSLLALPIFCLRLSLSCFLTFFLFSPVLGLFFSLNFSFGFQWSLQVAAKQHVPLVLSSTSWFWFSFPYINIYIISITFFGVWYCLVPDRKRCKNPKKMKIKPSLAFNNNNKKN